MEIDKENFKKVIRDFPGQFSFGLKLDGFVKPGFDCLVICAMGGSALPGNILADYFNEIKNPLPIKIHRDYNLPEISGKNPLVICISYSGNTEEAISGLEQALKQNLQVSGISTGGKIEKMCKENNLPWIKIPSGIQPRCATGYLFCALLKMLDISIKAPEFQELEETGKKLAKNLENKIPLIYASNKYKTIARIWKIKFNENSKIPAFWNFIPEMNHNEMVGFTNPDAGKFHAFMIQSEDDHDRNKKRMKLFSEILKEKGIKTDFVDIKGNNFLSKVFSTLLLGDWISYYLALENKVDPTPVAMVEQFKHSLEK